MNHKKLDHGNLELYSMPRQHDAFKTLLFTVTRIVSNYCLYIHIVFCIVE